MGSFIFIHCLADDSTFFLKDISSVKMFNEAGLNPLKWVLEAVFDFKTVHLTNDAIKLLGIHFWYHNET